MTITDVKDLRRFARRVNDDTVVDLMMAMVRRGQRADRKGDAEGLSTYQAAYDIYRAEAVRRGLVPR
jgi:hypothetical protein